MTTLQVLFAFRRIDSDKVHQTLDKTKRENKKNQAES